MVGCRGGRKGWKGNFNCFNCNFARLVCFFSETGFYPMGASRRALTPVDPPCRSFLAARGPTVPL